MMANGALRAMGRPVNGEGLLDAWNKGYRDYRDNARQVLAAGRKRNPTISAGSEITGAVISPIKFSPTRGVTGPLGNWVSRPADIARSRWQNAITTGAFSGIGITDLDDWDWNTTGNLAKNMGKSIITNAFGTGIGNYWYGPRNQMYQFGRGVMNASTQAIPYFWGNNNEETK